MVAQFFKILTAVIVVKVTGYALIVTLLQAKLAMPILVRLIAAALLCGNFFFVWLMFQKGRRRVWPLLACLLNLALVAGLMVLGAPH